MHPDEVDRRRSRGQEESRPKQQPLTTGHAGQQHQAFVAVAPSRTHLDHVAILESQRVPGHPLPANDPPSLHQEWFGWIQPLEEATAAVAPPATTHGRVDAGSSAQGWPPTEAFEGDPRWPTPNQPGAARA